MENHDVAMLLLEMANLLELHDENPHKVRAYRKGAEALLLIPEPVQSVAAADRLDDLPGIGPSLRGQIEEILAQGTTQTLEELRGRTPPGLRALLAIRGMTPRLARLIHERYGIDSREALDLALRSGVLRDLPGFGPREEATLLRALARGDSGHPTRW
jgi:DNA polymerase (family 10)